MNEIRILKDRLNKNITRNIELKKIDEEIHLKKEKILQR